MTAENSENSYRKRFPNEAVQYKIRIVIRGISKIRRSVSCEVKIGRVSPFPRIAKNDVLKRNIYILLAND